MDILDKLQCFTPTNEQERRDKAAMLAYIAAHDACFSREDTTAHVTVSAWTVNKEHAKALMVYHKLYDSWSWIGGHADGERDLCAVAMRELQEETGIQNATLVSDDIFSLEILPVNGHIKRGEYVSSHLHLNITYLFTADENDTLIINHEETNGVKWFTFEEALNASAEPWITEHIYKKLIKKTAQSS